MNIFTYVVPLLFLIVVLLFNSCSLSKDVNALDKQLTEVTTFSNEQSKKIQQDAVSIQELNEELRTISSNYNSSMRKLKDVKNAQETKDYLDTPVPGDVVRMLNEASCSILGTSGCITGD